MEISNERLVWMYRKMVEIRVFEEETSQLFRTGELPGFLHAYIGQEAVPVGVCANLRDDDYITSTHRGHGEVIAKGARLDRMAAELFGKETGYCRGKGGSMHIADFSIGILGANGIVGAGLPIANGAGLSAKLRGTDQVTVCFFGDGASNQGAFHEALNLASIWDLPVIFVCVNNQYAQSTPQWQHQRVRDISVRAQAYAIPGVTVDGNDVLAVYEAAREAVARARAGLGPTLLEAKTYRWLGHHTGDPGVYRPAEEVAEWRKRCPIERYRNYLLERGILTPEKIEEIHSEVQRAMAEALEFARRSPSPRPEEALEDIYA